MAIAFFDVDKTVLACNSATLWVKRELRSGHVSTWDALRAAFWMGLYSVGVAELDDVVRRAMASLRGQREREVIARTLAFWREEVSSTIRPGARAAVSEHKAKGDLVFLLTSSSNYLSMAIADELSLDGFLANRLLVDEQGLFTGVPVEPVCFGRGKVEHARGLAQKLSVPLEECWFYTDSYSDLPMLLAVGHPVVVHPDPRLRRLAEKRRWPIARWDAALLPSSTSTSEPSGSGKSGGA